MSTSLIRPIKILLVEDNLQDIEITRRAFTKARVKNDLIVVRDGEEALDYLYHRGRFNDPTANPRPGMILLDLNLPKISGLDVLRQLKTDPDLKTIPVIVLTVSQHEQDIAKSYDFGANSYIQKPVEFENFVKMIQAVQDYWIMIATLPSDGDRPAA